MRKGAKRNEWTTAEEAYLLAHAGRIPRRDISKHLKRGSKSIERKVASIRKSGEPITLRHYTHKTSVCPQCGKARSRYGTRTGVCRVCELSAQMEKCENDMSAVMQRMTMEDRMTYMETEAERSSTPLPRPQHPCTAHMTPYQKDVAEESYALEIETWEIGCLTRKLKAAQRRCERAAKKVKSMGV
ncbi:MAG: hypothetical protein RR842_04120 [Gordonibacter sp.]|uniref:hypothetical protein n=1 Tax=Gordonibacter sp. TaxID=1968902 RepID=UPI002FC7A307